MLKNYLKIAVRNLFKQRLLSLINILGLSVGLACFSLFMLYGVNEFNFDRFHEKADRIYRVYRWSEALYGRGAGGDVSSPMPLGPAMMADLQDVENYVRFRSAWGEDLVRVNNRVSRRGITYADPQVFDVFSFTIKYGDPATALSDPGKIVLTEGIADELFDVENPIGETIEIQIDDEFHPFIVSAIAEDLPSNSTITFDLLGSFEKLRQTNMGRRSEDNWRLSSFITFVLLREGSTLATDAERLLTFRERYYPDTEARLRESGNWTGEGAPITYRLQLLSDLHNETHVQGGFVDPVSPKNIWMLLGIAAGVLLIACINFTTLAIGRSAGRAREVGVRKVVGSTRAQLAWQFFIEALLLSVISAITGLLLARLFLPAFNTLSGRDLAFSVSQYPELIWLFVGLTVIAALAAGSYPALVLSGFRPIEVLKSKVRVGGANVFTRALVTVQFVLAVGLIICTIVVLQQVQFLHDKNPGFDKENVVIVDAGGSDSKRIYPQFRQLLSERSEIVGVSSAELSLGAGSGLGRIAWDFQGELKSAYEYFVDKDYLEVMGLELVSGRSFDLSYASDTLVSVIVNEAFVRDFGWTPENAIGQVLEGFEDDLEPIVIGVVRDFHYRPFHSEVEPQFFHMWADYAPFNFFVRIQPGDPARALDAVEDAWASVSNGLPFQYSFLDDNLDRFYRAEEQLGKIIGWAGGLSIFLSCLGLFGLATLAAANRTKEIGIRKVLGASYTSLIGLMSKGFIQLVSFAIVIAAPLAWYFMQIWLESFAYRIDVSWWYVALAGGAALLITFATVAIQSLRTALSNPVDALRYE